MTKSKKITSLPISDHEAPITIVNQNNVLTPDNQINTLDKKIFWVLFGIITTLLLVLSVGSGVNGDDAYQVDYADKLYKFYSSFGKDKSAISIPKGSMHYYGGFFDTITEVKNRMLGYSPDDIAYYNVRHLVNAMLGALAMLFTGLIVRDMAGGRAGALTLVFMALSPRFFGDSLMNPKDIPFAMGTVMALFFLLRLFREMPSPSWKTALGAALGIGIALGTRAGGLLLVGYCFLFGALDLFFKDGFQGFMDKKALKYLLWAGGTALLGYMIGILFWPFALSHPIKNPLEALTQFEKLSVKIKVLYEGANILSNKTPWHYPINWMWRTIPIFVVIGFPLACVFLVSLIKKYGVLPIFVLFFTAIFPIFYVIYRDSVLHDGWRHLTFVYPSMAALAALAWFTAVDMIKIQYAKYAIYGFLGILCLLPLRFMAANHSFPYIYFNELVGGMKGNFGQYETDYWGTSVKQGVEWLENQGILKENMTDTVTIASSFNWNVQRYVHKYGGKVRVKYVKYERRYDEKWDYALFPSRFVKAIQFTRGNFPERGKTIHTIDADGAPILAIMQDADCNTFRGIIASKDKKYAEATALFQAETAKYPENDLAWLEMANNYMAMDSLAQVLPPLNKSIEKNPENSVAQNLLGLYYIKVHQPAKAMEQFELVRYLTPESPVPYYYIGVMLAEKKEYNEALRNLERALQINPKFREALMVAAQIYNETGNKAQAEKLLLKAQGMK
jgi:Dolichyl-phosphate-mannose-protein mannosyltransferase/Tetratricopeptide repeat